MHVLAEASWRRDDSLEEKELFEGILKQRPDIQYVLAYENMEDFQTSRLEEDIESFQMKMERAYPDPMPYQARLDSLERSFQRLVVEYEQRVESFQLHSETSEPSSEPESV